jgi:hypothetical protein
LGVALLVALCTVGLTAGLAAADSDDEDGKTTAKQSSWFSFGNWFGQDKKTPEQKPPTNADSGKSTKPSKKNTPKKDSSGEEPATVEAPAPPRALEEAALLRRQDVCDRLAEIAVVTNNAELANLAERLKQRAWEVYTRRTAHLPTVTQAANYDLDEALMNKESRPGTVLPEGRADAGSPLPLGRDGQPITRREE